MRIPITLGLTFLISTWIWAQDQPPVSITPRVKSKADEPQSVIDRHANIRIDTTLVLVPVAVNDPLGRFVTGLDKENFKVFEDKSEQAIKQFSSDDAPMS